ncbi:hypothetical protein VMCG_09748 [Cytospora schulzeri]|uniref:Uncharacterized protein n=1 Tax=Cytospora schulzeri TaxID=448051 RepID=A0A423VH61_9PEZI|nr:hypothetical protein VMCG_09748 [Valsa malicola]
MTGEKDPHRSDLFIFDTDSLQNDILIRSNGGTSQVKYQEYAVFSKDHDYASTVQSADETELDGPCYKHIGHCVVSEDGNGDELFHRAFREDQAIDSNGNWGPRWKTPHLLQGRVRQVVCCRRANPRSSEDLNLDRLHLTEEDYRLMNLHPATLQYVRRTTVESMFWDRHHEKLSIILSFPSDPRTPYDFLSMTHSISDRTTTILIRQSFDANQHEFEDLDQYDQRMQSCRSHWAHPLVVPVMLLQVQYAWTEQAVSENHREVIAVERDVSNMAGFDAFDSTSRKRRLSSSTGLPSRSGTANGGGMGPGMGVGGGPGGSGGVRGRKGSTASTAHGGGGSSGGPQPQVYKKSTELMKNAHDVLKRSIRLLDTLRWMERAIKILIEAGDALDDVRQDSGGPTPSSAAFPTPLSSRGRVGTGLLRARINEDPLTGHWHEIRQYLEGVLQLCLSLETDRTILEMRCKALVDIIYSKMAQEDNNLNARMAVASSRDSSSMKALAVITAVFLPGEFISSLFGMSIFDWQPEDGDTIVSYRFWIYWCLTIPLTIVILVMWRAWWVGQDRYFRIHLSKDLSEERYWTDDRKPRELETSFLHDFLYMSVRRGESSVEAGPAIFPTSTRNSTFDEETRRTSSWFGRRRTGSGLTSPPTFRLRQIAFEQPEKGQRGNGILILLDVTCGELRHEGGYDTLTALFVTFAGLIMEKPIELLRCLVLGLWNAEDCPDTYHRGEGGEEDEGSPTDRVEHGGNDEANNEVEEPFDMTDHATPLARNEEVKTSDGIAQGTGPQLRQKTAM